MLFLVKNRLKLGIFQIMSYICSEKSEKRLSERRKFTRWTTIPQRALEVVRRLEKRQKREDV